jgi:hypothetical protein
VYNLIRSAERKELYPGDREDLIDFSRPGHAAALGEGWYDLEGEYGNKYRWIGSRATATLKRVVSGPMRLRIRGHAHELGTPAQVHVLANGQQVGQWRLDRTGLFILEAELPEAAEYLVEIRCSPVWSVPEDGRSFTVNLSMLRLVGRDK